MSAFKVPIEQIEAEARRATHDVTELARSMAEIGQLQPIILAPDLRLVAGWHRLQAARLLGWTEIDACYVSDVDAEIAAIDENLMRHELHYVERGEWLARRKALYEERHPEARHGGDRRSDKIKLYEIELDTPSFVQDAAAKTGRSAPAVYQELQIATKATPALKQALVERDVPKTDALKLVKLPEPAQVVAAEHIQRGAKPDDAVKAARAALPKPPRQDTILPVPSSVRLDVADAAALPLDDETVDLIVTSPPYGLSKAYAAYTDPSEGWHFMMQTWLAEAYRVARPGGRLALNVPWDTTEGGYRPTWPQACQAAVSAGWTYRWAIVWNEGNVSKSVARGSIDSAAAPHVITPVEVVGVFHKSEWGIETDKVSDLDHDEWLAWTNGLWTFRGETHPWEGHPAAFPLELPRRLVKLLSFPGDTVLDPFVGSGTTVLAAHQLGRVAWGFDHAPEYIESAKRRLAQTSQEVAA